MKKSTDEVVEFKMVFVIFIAFLIPITNTMHGNIHDKISLFNIQSRAKVYIRLLNKPYVKEVTLTGQNQLLNCC